MTSDLCSDDVVVCITSPQIIPVARQQAESVATGAPGSLRAATSTATVELGRRLLLAARAGDTPLVLDLMAKGAPFTTDWLGTSPLHLAAGNAHVETCAVLLRAGFSRDARTKVQRTPLHLAAYGGHAAAARLLLDAGAAVDCRDLLRMTPLHWAAQRGHCAAAAELLRRGADPAALSKFHKTPLSIARERRADDLLKLIEDAVKEREAADSVDALVNEQTVEAAAAEPQLRSRRVQMFDAVQRMDDDARHPGTKHAEKKVKIDTPVDSGNLKRDDLIKIIEDAIKDKGGTKTSDAGLSIVNEQLADSPTREPQLFDTVQKLQEVKFNKFKQDRNIKVDTQLDGSAGAALLRSHGITLLPPDHTSTVLNALQSGRTIVLSDAGKLMLKESESRSGGARVRLASGAGARARLAAAAGAAGAGPGAARAVRLAAGVKVFTVSNKLLAAPRDRRGKLPSPQDVQVKFVRLPPNARIVSPSKPVPGGCGPRPSRPAVKIVVNENDFDELVADAPEADVVRDEPQATSTTTEAVPVGENAVCVPEEFLRSSSPRYLRTQLLAAHRALAALQADLHACKARLARYETL